MNKKFNPNNGMAFYFKVKVTIVVLECKFYSKFVHFNHEDFRTQFGLEYKGMEVFVLNAPNVNRADFVKMISK